MNSKIIQKIINAANISDVNGFKFEADYLTKLAQDLIHEDFGNNQDPDIFELGEDNHVLKENSDFYIEASTLLFDIAKRSGLELVNFSYNLKFNKDSLMHLKTKLETLKQIIRLNLHPRESGLSETFHALGENSIFNFSTREIHGFDITREHRLELIRLINEFLDLINYKSN